MSDRVDHLEAWTQQALTSKPPCVYTDILEERITGEQAPHSQEVLILALIQTFPKELMI